MLSYHNYYTAFLIFIHDEFWNCFHRIFWRKIFRFPFDNFFKFRTHFNTVKSIYTLGKDGGVSNSQLSAISAYGFHTFTKGKREGFGYSRTSNLLDCFECTDVCRNRYELPVSPVITRNKASFSRAFIANRIQTFSPFASLSETAMLFTRRDTKFDETCSLLPPKRGSICVWFNSQ